MKEERSHYDSLSVHRIKRKEKKGMIFFFAHKVEWNNLKGTERMKEKHIAENFPSRIFSYKFISSFFVLSSFPRSYINLCICMNVYYAKNDEKCS